MRHLVLGVLVSLGFTAQVSAADPYLCVADMVTGFAYNKALDRWQATEFQATRKYVVKKSANPPFSFEVTALGTSYPIASCQAGFSEYGFLNCEGPIEFRMNRNNLRYTRVYFGGYIGAMNPAAGTEDGGDSPTIEIGKCTAF